MRRITVAGLRRRASRAKAAARVRPAGSRRVAPSARPRAAVDFADWVRAANGTRRRRLSRTCGGPGPTPGSPSRAGSACWCMPTIAELVGELLAQLAAIPVQFDLIVTNGTGAPLGLNLAPLANLRQHRRAGRATITAATSGRWCRWSTPACSTRTRSCSRCTPSAANGGPSHQELAGSGEQWRAALIDSLLGSPDNVQSILSAFAEDPDLGVVTAPDSVLGPEFWGGDLRTDPRAAAPDRA